MGFWNRTRPEQPDVTPLNPLDRATKALALTASRRGFLKNVSIGAAALGLGLAARPAVAQTCATRQNKTGSCGSCTPLNSLPRRSIQVQERTCNSSCVCGSWRTVSSTCEYC